MRHRLGAVEQHRHAPCVRQRDDLRHGQDRAERVRHVGGRHQAGPDAEQRLERLQVQLAACVDRRDLEHGTGGRAGHLPGHDVGVVLEPGDQHLVAGLDARPQERVRHQVDRLGGAAREDDLADRAGVDEAADALAGGLERVRGPLRKGVHAAVHVRVHLLGVAPFGVDHRPRTLGGRAVVEVHQRPAVDPLAEDREIGAEAADVERWVELCGRVHAMNSRIVSAAGRRPSARRSTARRTASGSRRRRTSPTNA